jgi:cytochrome P450
MSSTRRPEEEGEMTPHPPSISPMPPLATGLGLPWDVPVEDPVVALREARWARGDTFVVDSGEDRYLFTFSPPGVRSFYALPEERASKAVADWRMLRRKLPDGLFVGRRTLPHQLFGRDDVADYLTNVQRALGATVADLGTTSEAEVFALTRRLGHRVGLASWGGPGSSDGSRFDRLTRAFDVLDGADSFVHPDAMAAVASSQKSAEIGALAAVTTDLGVALLDLPGHEREHPLFVRIAEQWQDAPSDERAAGVAMDVALIHIASMSNLFAALGWALVDLVDHPEDMERVRSGDRSFTETCSLESTRLAQRSIMARYVTEPVTLDTGEAVHHIDRGVTIATLLPLTNTSSGPGLSDWDPHRWNRRRLADTSSLAAVELVTVFGHGRHTCPAQPYSLSAMTTVLVGLLDAFDFEPGWVERPRPVRAQIGGVARSAEPCLIRYRRRSGRSPA